MKHSSRQTSLDLYLTRASHVAQIVLVVAAVFGYIYTVLPIYQKELLSEEIAKRTIELAEIQDQLKFAESERSELGRLVGELGQQGESLSKDIAIKEARLGAVTKSLIRTHYVMFVERVEFLVGVEYLFVNWEISAQDILESGNPSVVEGFFLSPYSAITKALAGISEASFESPGIISQKQIDTYRAKLLKVVEKNKSELLILNGNAKDILVGYLSEMDKNKNDPTPQDRFNEAQWKVKEKHWKMLHDSFKKDMDRAMNFVGEQKQLK